VSQPTKVFHLGDLLSITTRHLFAPTHLDGVWALVEHVTGEARESDLHAVELAVRTQPELRRQHPWLDHAIPPATDDKNELMTWFAQQVVERGAFHEVEGAQVVVDAEIVEEVTSGAE
jgi:hypothetical protein